MKFLSIILLLFVITTDIKMIASFSANSKFIKADNIGNIYTINGIELCMYNQFGEKTYSYSNNSLGTISSVDVTNPMRIILFYKDFNKVVFLSNKLTEINSPIALDNIGLEETTSCCYSNLGGIWIYNNVQNQPICLSADLKPIFKGTYLQNHIINNDSIISMAEINNELYMLFKNSGLIVFDKFGIFKKKYDIKNIHGFSIIKNNVICYNNEKIFFLNNEQLTDSLVFTEKKDIISTYIIKNKIYTSDSKNINVYQIE